ncbi:hypothetical protein Sango_0228300 [Sesamum angolense]|uniref:DUF4283 domain-containing protein n=1 Tax=Sesamum angolense TaxID=2727404 RepID=A0AAE1XHN3_9LAMI|nr:hypothetical protein Sango_0228300 [Sesamum angolense]
MRVFKWSPTFTPEQESSITPIWVSFLELPAHLYRKDAPFAIANNIGTPLQIADSTLNQSNLAKAQVCVEIDLPKPLLKEIDLKIYDAIIVQNIVYEHIPNYCSLCKHVGHCDAECYSKEDDPKPPSHRWNFGKKAAAKYKLKGMAVVQDVYKVLDKMPEKTEVGECSKNAVDHHRYVSVAVLNSQKEIGNYNNTSVIEADVNCGKNYMHEDKVNAENDILDCENIGFACGIEEKNVGHPTENENEENAFNLGEKAVGIMITRPNNIVGDLRRGNKGSALTLPLG